MYRSIDILLTRHLIFVVKYSLTILFFHSVSNNKRQCLKSKNKLHYVLRIRYIQKKYKI